jgi:ferredoxin
VTTRDRYRRGGATRHKLSVNNDRCRRYGFCEAEAPALFRLMATGDLRYERSVAEEQLNAARSAVRCCPTLAIKLEER